MSNHSDERTFAPAMNRTHVQTNKCSIKTHFPTLSFYHYVQFLSMWLFTKILENNSMFFVYFNYWQRMSSKDIAQKTGYYFMHFCLFSKSQLWKMHKRDNEKKYFFVHFTYWQTQPRYVIIFQILAKLVGTNSD